MTKKQNRCERLDQILRNMRHLDKISEDDIDFDNPGRYLLIQAGGDMRWAVNENNLRELVRYAADGLLNEYSWYPEEIWDLDKNQQIPFNIKVQIQLRRNLP